MTNTDANAMLSMYRFCVCALRATVIVCGEGLGWCLCVQSVYACVCV
jgi:hypothetical protein